MTRATLVALLSPAVAGDGVLMPANCVQNDDGMKPARAQLSRTLED
jgi:hypothetical protein